MPTDRRAALAGIRRFDQLIVYLRDELAWPIADGDFEDLTFDYTAEELGIDDRNAVNIKKIKRLRPLAPNQPWGIFFVKFEPKRLPVVALRRVLGQVTLRKRASANRSERQAWAADDLLFVSNYGEGDARRISFAHFAQPDDGRGLPTLKVLGWNNLDTALHLDAVASELTEHLAWPDDEDDADAWRAQWRAAFNLRHREVVTTSRALSVRLAGLARAIRDRIGTVLAIETGDGRVTKLMEAFREALMHDLDAGAFADMYAQTIAYGLLSARIADPDRKTADDLAGQMRTNPFLREIMATFLEATGRRGGAGGPGIDFDEIGASEVVELLDDANMEAVIRDFGDRNPREDPVIHFYELFLKEYDARKRMQRGVFYTPRPVVSYIVRSVDQMLRTEFGLTDGLADTATWGEMLERYADLKIPPGISPDSEFVRILDPATGTGTFLVEAIDLIHATLASKWKEQGHGERRIAALWNEYVPRHLLPRLHGYELLMAPYAIAHLKISLKLYETGYRFGSDERARVYLTNALEPAHDFSGTLAFAIPALAHEAQAVSETKDQQRFTVVIGNPPYSGHSANKGEWIGDLLRGRDGDERTESYFEVDDEPLNERNPKWLNDDYVKFIRYGQWAISLAGAGVLGFITNHSYLDNPTFRGMRESLTAFDAVHLLDLHGNAKKRERAPDGGKDENVFDIQQGVAVGLFAKRPARGAPGRILHADLWGQRESGAADGKYGWLAENHVETTEWTTLSPKPPLRLLVPRDEALHDEYAAGWRLTDIFPVNSVGIVTARDKLAIQWTAADMCATATDFASRSAEDARESYAVRDSSDWTVRNAQRDIRDHPQSDTYVVPVLYRPFDVRFTYYTGRAGGFICRPRPKVMRHMLTRRHNLAIITTRQCQRNWSALVSNTIIGHKALAAYDINTMFPLYLYQRGHDCLPTTIASKCLGTLLRDAVDHRIVRHLKQDTGDQLYVSSARQSTEDLQITRELRMPNLNREFVRAVASAVHLEFDPIGSGDLESAFGPEDVFHYLYAVLHSPEYRRRYADFLKSDFARVPLTGDRTLFVELVRLGARLVGLHVMEAEGMDGHVDWHGTGDNRVERVRYAPPSGDLPGRVWINRRQYCNGVAPEVWAFAIGGYRPAEKWLKDRKGRTLTNGDVAHYRKIVAALAETIPLMAGIDEAIEQHGGWPGAFQPGATETADAEVIPFRPPVVEPDPEDCYVTCVPLVPLQAAAGAFGDPQYIEEDGFEWVAVESPHGLRKGMFVAQVVGRSMEPAIPDGAYCLFRAPVEGSRQGRTVLVQLRDLTDPETDQRYTVKRYASEKVATDDSWQHTRITLKPVNPDFDPIVLTATDEGELQVVAELLEVLGENA